MDPTTASDKESLRDAFQVLGRARERYRQSLDTNIRGTGTFTAALFILPTPLKPKPPAGLEAEEYGHLFGPYSHLLYPQFVHLWLLNS